MPEKGHGHGLEGACAGILCGEGFYLFISLLWERLLGEGFSRLFISFSRCIFNMLMHQNKRIGECGIDYSLVCFTVLLLS